MILMIVVVLTIEMMMGSYKYQNKLYDGDDDDSEDDNTDANEGWAIAKWQNNHGDDENNDNDNKTDGNEGRGSGRPVIKDCKKFCIQRRLHCHGFRICQAKYK